MMLYSCTHVAPLGVKGLIYSQCLTCLQPTLKTVLV